MILAKRKELFDPSQQSKHLKFSFEDRVAEDLHERLVALGQDVEICKFYLSGRCKDSNCKFRHQKPKSVVCKHYIRGLCKKSDTCEFLHEYALDKMPPCQFIATYGECSKGNECPFLHITPEDLIRDCAWYARGFCKHGPNCRNRHTRREACRDYLAGFCPLGKNCSNGHPKHELPTEQAPVTRLCSRCGQMGHLVDQCRSDPVRYDEVEPPPEFGRAALHNKRQQGNFKASSDQYSVRAYMNRAQTQERNDRSRRSKRNDYHNHNNHNNHNNNNNNRNVTRPLSEVECYKCGEHGHYANKCPNERRNYRRV